MIGLQGRNRVYKLILVDDEAEVREGMLRRIDWEAGGFLIAGEAENGREALELVERDPPDIVITDISMPVMDGMELGRTLRERFPLVKVVFLTGFDEFAYARQAVQMQAEDYLLKPVTAAAVFELLGRLRAKLDEEAAHLEDVRQLRAAWNLSKPLLRDKFLSSLLRKPLRREWIDRARGLGVALEAQGYLVAALAVDECGLGASEFHDDPDLAQYAVLNLANELVERHMPHHAVLDEDRVLVLFLLSTPDAATAYAQVWTALESIRVSVERYLRFTVSIGVGGAVDTPERIHRSGAEALRALEYRVIHGANRILYIQDMEQGGADLPQVGPDQTNPLRLAVKVGEREGIRQAVDAFFHPFAAEVPSLAGVQAWLLGLLGQIVGIAAELGVPMDAVLPAGHTWMTPLALETMGEIRAWVTAVCESLGARASGQRQSGARQLVEQAKACVRTHYADPELSVPSVAAALHLSPSYFSALFKKETGETFLNHLVRTRMDVARELLGTTDMKTADIAERVGYPDPHYFSYFFKKNMGISPKEYRAGLRKT